MQLPHCPKCDSTYTYEDSGMYICPECAHEWNPAEATEESDILIVKDANGNFTGRWRQRYRRERSEG